MRTTLGIIFSIALCLLCRSATAAEKESAKPTKFKDFPELSKIEGQIWSPNQLYRVEIEKPRPTQFSLGFRERNFRAEKMEKMDDDEFDQERIEKAGLVLRDPESTIWLLDGHHMGAALLKMGKTKMLVRVKNVDWTAIRQLKISLRKSVMGYLKAKKLVWLFDENDEPRSIFDLPRKISLMTNDPFRSFAWLMRKKGAYNETETQFAEFYWARYFRSHFHDQFGPLKDEEDLFDNRVIFQGLNWAHYFGAHKLPGYIPCADEIGRMHR